MKIAIITCKSDPDYIRARTLRAGLAACDDVDMIVIKNTSHGVFRYAEVLGKILQTRFRDHPDAYLLTFRGYELLAPLLLIAGNKPVIFDEFINLTEWVVYEHQKMKVGSLPAKLLNQWYTALLRQCRFILTDTKAHATFSQSLSKIKASRYRAIPVGTDESVFHASRHKKPQGSSFEVFYYANMLKLHGIQTVLDAIETLKDQQIHFTIVGGKKETETLVRAYIDRGCNITYKEWIPFEELPNAIGNADMCLAGPFGGTIQSQLVITGKTYQFMASGAPTLVGKAKLEKSENVFQDKVNCLVVPQADSKALAKSITWAYKHPTELIRIGEQGRKLYETHFSEKEIAKYVRALVNDLQEQ